MDIQFYESYPKRTVVAVMEDVRAQVFEHIEKRMPHLDFFAISNVLSKMNMPKKLTGKAHCNLEEDVYDEDIGCKIAEYRLRQKYNRLLTRVYASLAMDLHRDAMFAIGMAERYEYSLDDEDKYTHRE
jgi:hypothetical protein